MLPTDSVWWYEEVGAHFTSPESLAYLQEMSPQLGLSQHIVDWQVSQLSTGEKQRLALLRSLQIRPDILLLDEPTSALDFQNTQLVETLLLSLKDKEQLTLLWVSHDQSQLARVCDIILYMTKDRLTLVAPGTGD
jgi:ABC-type dipeptide/oligopeptide/nickel transport system ATPase subunit